VPKTVALKVKTDWQVTGRAWGSCEAVAQSPSSTTTLGFIRSTLVNLKISDATI
jgi:hypothetical protein